MSIRMSTISDRGWELASQSMRKKFSAILGNPYDAKKNPEGFVNIGTAENVLQLPATNDDS